MEPESPRNSSVAELSLPVDRDFYLRSVIRELAGTLHDTLGFEEASGLLSLVGQRLADEINTTYRQALACPCLSRAQVADVLVDIERRIDGAFHIIEQDDEKMVFGNRACPFGAMAVDRPALCMLTSSVFGVLGAENLGYSKVVLEATIAQGAEGCRVVVFLRPTAEAEAANGREFFRG